MLKKDRLLIDAIILASPQVFNLVFKVFMVNLLKFDYSQLGSFIAMLAIVATPLSALTAWASHRTSHFVVEGDAAGLRRFTMSSLRTFALVGLAAGVIVLLAGLSLNGSVAPENPAVTEVFAACVVFVFLSPIFNGLLQGRQRYGWMAAYWFVFGAGKLAFGGVFLALGLEVSGGLLGILGAYVTGAAFAVFALTRITRPIAALSAPAAPSMEMRYLGLSAVALTAMSLMFFSDEVMARVFMAKAQADVFSSAKIIGSIFIYAPIPLIASMFPKVTERHMRGESTMPLLWKCFGITAGALLAGIVGWWLVAATPAAQLLMGESNYGGAGALSRSYALAIIPYAAVNVLVQFSVARGRWRFLAVLAPAAIIHVAIVYFARADYWNIITAVGVFGTIVVALVLLLQLTDKRVVKHES